jgi:hypothetical protein
MYCRATSHLILLATASVLSITAGMLCAICGALTQSPQQFDTKHTNISFSDRLTCAEIGIYTKTGFVRNGLFLSEWSVGREVSATFPKNAIELECRIVATGFPFHCMSYCFRDNGRTLQLESGIQLSMRRFASLTSPVDGRVLPIHILPLAFTLNVSIFFIGLVGIQFALHRAGCWSRRMRGKCMRCGYPISGLACCPECGSPVYSDWKILPP